MAVAEETTIWHPADLFSPSPNAHHGFAVIVLNQSLKQDASFYRTVWNNAVYKVAADGGADQIHSLNKSNPRNDLEVDVIIGDLDSLLPEGRKYWEEKNIPIIHDSDQYSTDFMKAVHHIRASDERKSLNIVALGGLGGRVDQGMSVLSHLYSYQKEPGYPSGRMFLLSTESITFVLKAGRHRIKAKEMYPGIGLAKHVGIIPLKESSVITTQGLEWDVTDWPTEFGGQMSTSNHVKEEWVMVETTKDVLFTIDLDISSR